MAANSGVTSQQQKRCTRHDLCKRLVELTSATSHLPLRIHELELYSPSSYSTDSFAAIQYLVCPPRWGMIKFMDELAVESNIKIGGSDSEMTFVD